MEDSTNDFGKYKPEDKGQIDCEVILAACPCGKTPNKLHISEGNTCKYAFVYGDCCGEWNIEFRTDYFKLDSVEIKVLAADAWNSASRAK